MLSWIRVTRIHRVFLPIGLRLFALAIVVGAALLWGAVSPASAALIDFESTLSAVRAQDRNGMDSGWLIATPTVPAVAAIANNGILLDLGLGFDAAVASSASGDLGAAAAVDCIECKRTLGGGQFVASNAQLFDFITAHGSFSKGESIPVTITEDLSYTIATSANGNAFVLLDTFIGRDAKERGLLFFPGVTFDSPLGDVHLVSDGGSPGRIRETFWVKATDSGVTTFQLWAQLTALASAVDNGFALVNALSTGRIFIDSPGITFTGGSGRDYSTPGASTSVPEPPTVFFVGGAGMMLLGHIGWRRRSRVPWRGVPQ